MLNLIAFVFFFFGIVLTLTQNAAAQQVCYSYDGLGRLTGVIDQNNEAAFYDYDAVGNILSIRRESPSGPVTIFSFDPPGGAPGGTVEVFGVGFSSTANENQVTIGGVPATVVSTIPCTLVVEVPANVVSGQISVTTPLGTGVSAQIFTPFTITIPPAPPAVLIGTTQQFTANLGGCPDPRVVWSVNGIVGGNATVGTISSTGLYTAPASVPASGVVTIRVQSLGCTGLFAETTVTIVTELLGFVFANASVNYGAPPPLFPTNVVLQSVSASHGPVPFVSPPDVVIHSASASHGEPGAQFPVNVVFDSASVANVPVITSMSPSSAGRGSNFNIVITGVNLTGASDLRFVGSSLVDAAITATNVTVNPTGTSLTANVSILSTATVGTRTVVVQGASGDSTIGMTGVNSLNVTP